jgi:acylphosphatase
MVFLSGVKLKAWDSITGRVNLMSELVSFHALVRGRVQGVFFRAFAAEKADELGLTGYVRNLKGGREVEVHAEGERAQLELLMASLRKGPPAARVEDVTSEWSLYSGKYATFSVLY